MDTLWWWMLLLSLVEHLDDGGQGHVSSKRQHYRPHQLDYTYLCTFYSGVPKEGHLKGGHLKRDFALQMSLDK